MSTPTDKRCMASQSGQHERDPKRDDAGWYCFWCSEELGPDTPGNVYPDAADDDEEEGDDESW